MRTGGNDVRRIVGFLGSLLVLSWVGCAATTPPPKKPADTRKTRRPASPPNHPTSETESGGIARAEIRSRYNDLIRQGQAHYSDWRLEEAKQAFREAMSLDPLDARSHYMLGNVIFDQGRIEEAIPFFVRAVELEPGFGDAHSILASSYDELGQYDLAIAHYERALEIAPKSVDYLELGVVYRNKKMYEEAIGYFQKAILADPSYALAHRNLAITLAALGRDRDAEIAWETALQAYRAAVSRQPDDAQAHLAFGFALEEQGRVVEAIASYRKAIELDSHTVAAFWALGRTLVKAGEPQEAIAACRMAVELQPEYGLTHFLLAQALDAAGKKEEAEAEFAEARRLGYGSRK